MRIFMSIVAGLYCLGLLASTPPAEILKNYEVKHYSIQKAGLKDLVLNVHVQGLKERLNAGGSYGKLGNISFTIYWSHPDKMKIVANGISPKFQELQAFLSADIAALMSKVLFTEIGPRLEGFTVETKDEAKGQASILAVDQSGKRAVNQMLISFADEGKSIKSESFGIGGPESQEMSFMAYPWSNNKFALTKIVNTKQVQGKKLTITTNLEYQNSEGYGLPSKITVLSEADGKKIAEQNYILSGHMINTGNAGKELMRPKGEENAN